MSRYAVLGTGGFGTAMAIAVADAGQTVRLWGRDPAHVATIAATRENARSLPGTKLPPEIELESDPGRAVHGVDVVLAVIPMQFLRATLGAFVGRIPAAVPVVSGSKGFEIGTMLRPTQVCTAVLGARPVATLSGPSHAEEIALGLPVSLAIAAQDVGLARRLRDELATPRMRLYVTPDVTGVEVAAALKNVVAIAAGVCDGLELGDNAKAALVTRGLAEIARFGVDCGALPETFMGLGGLGDLLTTCYSRHGRNRRVGELLARGKTLDEILASTTQVAEGIGTTRALAQSGDADFSRMPLAAEVHAILFDRKDPRRSVVDLMTRPPRDA